MPSKRKPTKNIRVVGYGSGWRVDTILQYSYFLGSAYQGKAWSMPLQPGQELICLIRQKPRRKRGNKTKA